MRKGVEKLSVSVPRSLAGALRKRVGRRGVSKFVAQAVQQALERERLTELLAELDSKVGAVPEQTLSEVRREWLKKS